MVSFADGLQLNPMDDVYRELNAKVSELRGFVDNNRKEGPPFPVGMRKPTTTNYPAGWPGSGGR